MTGVATSKLHAGKTVALLGPFSCRTTWNNNWSKDIHKLPRIDWWLPNDVIGYMIRSLHFYARFFSGEGRGSSSSDGLEIAHSQKLSEIVLLAPNQAGTKQGRRYSHFNWALEQLWAALSRRCSQQDLPRQSFLEHSGHVAGRWLLYCLTSSLPHALDFSMHGSNKEHKCMKEHEDTYVAVAEKYTLDGANTFMFMKHKHERHTHE